MQRLAFSTAVVPKLRAFSRVYPRVEGGVGEPRNRRTVAVRLSKTWWWHATSTISWQTGIAADHTPQ